MRLQERLRAAWSAETSSDDSWSPENPALGQCAVTALIVQGEWGGDLLRSEVGGVSHYWNRLDDGTEVDLTRDQFADFRLTAPVVVRRREYLLSNPDTAARLDLLRRRL